MPRYFFHIHHERRQIDLCGEELTDFHTALREATTIAGRILQDIDGKLKFGQPWRMEVTDEFANPIFEINVIAKRIS